MVRMSAKAQAAVEAGKERSRAHKQRMTEQTRMQFFDAGIELLNDPEMRIRDMRTRRVAEVAGRTTGAFFNAWADKEAFYSDLMGHILNPRYDMHFDEVNTETADAKLVGGDAHTQWTRPYFESLATNRIFMARQAIVQDMESLLGAAESLIAYYDRHTGAVNNSLHAMLGVSLPEKQWRTFARSSDNLGLWWRREQITFEEATLDIASRIPEA